MNIAYLPPKATGSLRQSTHRHVPYHRSSISYRHGFLASHSTRPGTCGFPLTQPPKRLPTLTTITSSSLHPSVAASVASFPTESPKQNPISSIQSTIAAQLHKMDGLWSRFIPMSCLFFLMAFVNTIIDSLKDSLVITAVGGGTEVLPYLSVYGVLPCSVVFLLAYSWGTQRFTRERLFNVIILGFLSFYLAFAFLYPYHEALHLDSWAESLTASLPSGLSGLVGMIRNWLFTLFYCASELWGDIVLSLLFWGLANETTSIEDAPLLYPLFGIGANIAQTVAGRSLRLISDISVLHMSYTFQLQATIGFCIALGFVIVGLHAFISKTFPKNPKGSTAAKMARLRARQQQQQHAMAMGAAGNGSGRVDAKGHAIKIDIEASVPGLNYCEVNSSHEPGSTGLVVLGRNTDNNNTLTQTHAARIFPDENVPLNSTTTIPPTTTSTTTAASSTTTTTTTTTTTSTIKKKDASNSKKALSLKEAFDFLSHSPQIRCLAVMALAQGITTRLLEVSWKHYLHKLATTPSAYAAFLGDTAMWTGIVTGSLMLTSPMMFDKLGWRGVASATPNFMIWGGIPFFIGCIVYNFISMQAVAGTVTLQALVITGAIMQVFSRGAKFSLFKPAEEMVYIGLDDESRTKGKAAIDVVGAQSGKSISSVLQQVLLIITGGTVGGILPVLAVFYAIMLQQWNAAVADLDEHYDPAHVHRLSVMGSLDEDDNGEGDSTMGVVGWQSNGNGVHGMGDNSGDVGMVIGIGNRKGSDEPIVPSSSSSL